MNYRRTKVIAGAFALLLSMAALMSFPAARASEQVEMTFSLPPLELAVSWPAVAAVGENVYVIGGTPASSPGLGIAYDCVQIYNAVTGETTRGAKMLKGVSAATCGVANGKIYVAGGWNQTDVSYYQHVQIYDPALDSWTLAATGVPEPIGRSSFAMGTDGILYVFGGGWTSNVTLMYNTSADTWSYGLDQPVTGLDGTAVYYNSTMVFLIGGNYGGASSTVRIYNPEANSWSLAGSLTQPTVFGSALLARNGDIYLFGGSSSNSTGFATPYATIERYNVAADSWEAISAALSAGNNHAGVALDGFGRALVVGGYDGAGATAAVDSVVMSTIEGSYKMQISSPTDGGIVSGITGVRVDMVNGFGSLFASVDLFVDGVLHESRTYVQSAVFLWDTTSLAPGSSHVLMARGYYFDGSVSEDSVTVTVSGQSVEDAVAAIQQQLAVLQTLLTIPDANLTALAIQAAILQAKLDAIIAGSIATSNAMNATFAGLQQQLDDFQTQIDRVENKADTASMYGLVTLILVIIVIVLVGLMVMMVRKK